MSTESNKEAVRRFNTEVIQQGRRDSFEALIAQDFVNRSAPPGSPNDAESMWNTFENVLRPALSDLRVTVQHQVAEGDCVTTRKQITGTHTGHLLGVEATHKPVTIDVIDIVRLRDGRYTEHWGINNLANVLATLKAT
jgi:predicted ester cyclase